MRVDHQNMTPPEFLSCIAFLVGTVGITALGLFGVLYVFRLVTAKILGVL